MGLPPWKSLLIYISVVGLSSGQLSIDTSSEMKLQLNEAPQVFFLSKESVSSQTITFSNSKIAKSPQEHEYYSLNVNFFSLETSGASSLGPLVTVKSLEEGDTSQGTVYFISQGSSWDFEEPSLTIPLSSSIKEYRITVQLAGSVRSLTSSISLSTQEYNKLHVNHPQIYVLDTVSRIYEVQVPHGVPQAVLLL